MNKVTAATIAAILLTVGHAGAAPVCGDVNDNGSVTSSDALLVLKNAVGQAVELLCELGSIPLQTGQTEVFGAGTDGELREGLPHSYTDNGDGTVTDNMTGLMWEKKDDSNLAGAAGIHDKDNSYSWSTGPGSNVMDGTLATTFLATLNSGNGFAGHTDWRVPNAKELQTIQVFGRYPAVDPRFDTNCTPGCTITMCSCVKLTSYWSSSTYHGLPNHAWVVDTEAGYTGALEKEVSFQARAVRSAP